MISFLCPHCHQSLQIADQFSGQAARCCSCGTIIQVPGFPKRTAKPVIIGRISFLPLLALAFFAFFLAHVPGLVVPFVLGGIGCLAFMIFFQWGVTNFGTWLTSPREYKIWKSGGGDPYFDTVDPPLNNDPPEVRYQELFREKRRQELNRFGVQQPQVPPDEGWTLDDPL